MKAYPTVNIGIVWVGNLIYTPDKLEAVTQTISDLDLKKECQSIITWLLFLIFRQP